MKPKEKEKLLSELIYETFGGSYGVVDITEHDQILGIYNTYKEAYDACLYQLQKYELTQSK